jgi:hypothetical protein
LNTGIFFVGNFFLLQQKQLRILESFHEMLDFIIREGREGILIGWGRAEEEGSADNIVDVTVFVAESTVEREPKELTFFIADKGNGFSKGKQGLDVTSYHLLHGFQG